MATYGLLVRWPFRWIICSAILLKTYFQRTKLTQNSKHQLKHCTIIQNLKNGNTLILGFPINFVIPTPVVTLAITTCPLFMLYPCCFFPCTCRRQDNLHKQLHHHTINTLIEKMISSYVLLDKLLTSFY